MSALRQEEIFFTVQEYLAFENYSESRHEYFKGQIYAMAGATEAHIDIAANVLTQLKIQLRGKSCVLRGNAQRIYIPESELLTYPDIVVVCPPKRYSETDRLALTDATVIIEVLSPSTARYDKGTKFEYYQHMPSLRHYILVEQGHFEVEHRFLDDLSSKWESETFKTLADSIVLAAVGCTISLADVYEGIDF